MTEQGRTVRDALEVDMAAIVRIYVRGYAQPPWNEHNEPAASERYLREVVTVPETFCLVADEAELTAAADGGQPGAVGAGSVLGFVLAGVRAYEAFVEDWARTAERPATGWPVIRGKLGYIWEIVVEPAAQRRGTGTALLGAAITRLQRDGVECVLLRSSERATAAVALYRHFGFERLPVLERRDPLGGPWVLSPTK